MRADALEDVLDRNVRAIQFSRRDRSAVEHHAGNVEPAESHDDAGHILVATADANQAIKEVAARDQLDGIGDDFTRDQRSLHPLRAHGDAVGDGDGVEFHRRAAGLANALLDGFG